MLHRQTVGGAMPEVRAPTCSSFSYLKREEFGIYFEGSDTIGFISRLAVKPPVHQGDIGEFDGRLYTIVALILLALPPHWQPETAKPLDASDLLSCILVRCNIVRPFVRFVTNIVLTARDK